MQTPEFMQFRAAIDNRLFQFQRYLFRFRIRHGWGLHLRLHYIPWQGVGRINEHSMVGPFCETLRPAFYDVLRNHIRRRATDFLFVLLCILLI